VKPGMILVGCTVLYRTANSVSKRILHGLADIGDAFVLNQHFNNFSYECVATPISSSGRLFMLLTAILCILEYIPSSNSVNE
jgi:hypothetical protein